MTVLHRVNDPSDLKNFTPQEVQTYCDELREFLIESVTRTGGHLGSNLGVVELTVALHRVFDFAHDRLVLDTSHQVYPHKVITGRREMFPTLRSTGGMSGFMHRGESPYDTFTSGHAGTAVSVAAGMAMADQVKGVTDRRVVALVGDASAGSGATLEALNHAGHGDANLLVILNDNQWSIARTVGALRGYLNRVRTLNAYREGKEEVIEAVNQLPFVGHGLGRWAQQVKEAVANYMSPGHLFRELGWTYFGPENGHDVKNLESLLWSLERVKGPVLLHVITEKGRGAPEQGNDAAHAVKPRKSEAENAEQVVVAPAGPPVISYSNAFGRAVVHAMERDDTVTAITAAMPGGTGLAPVIERFPKRVIDVGICEQHGVGVAAGMADSGLRPIVTIYSTFLQRAFDQVWQEVVVQDLPVVMAMDRAGIVGGDGVTHQGLYDITYLRAFPGITLMAPADPPELETMLQHGLSLNSPSAVRYKRGGAPDASLPSNDAPLRQGKGALLREGTDAVLFAYGSMVEHALEAADLLQDEGVSVAVFNARFARPLDTAALDAFVVKFPLLMTLEEHTVNGGFGSAVLEHLATLPTPPACTVRVVGVPDRLVWHGEAADWFAHFRLDPKGLAERVRYELSVVRAS